MAADGISPALAIRSSVGIELWASSGPKLPYEYNSIFPREETKNSRSISFSLNGCHFAYSNGQEIKVLRTIDWTLQCILPRPKAFYLKFSPLGNYLCTWELYTVTKTKPEGSPNMFVYEVATGTEVFSIVQKNQTDWEPSWSSNETLFALIVGGEARFYDLCEGPSGFQSIIRKIGGSRGGMLSLGPGSSPPYLAFYTPGANGAPSTCKLYKYPAISSNQAVSSKSFFQTDRIEMLWNKRGTGLLLLTSTEVDKSGASYYGNQALHFMSTKDDSCSVPLSKEGPVHCVKWSPKANEFVVVYGFMPSKTCLYNLKCDIIFDFGEGPHNNAYFNPFGNLIVLAGFGNLPGNVEIWDVKRKEKLAEIKCPDTTCFEWNPNGEYFVTATTAPRLRIGNGFKVYHYSGALMHETIWEKGQELLAVEWQKYSENTFSEPIITKTKQQGIKSSQPEASKNVYTPPHLRLIKEGKNPEKYLPQPQSKLHGLSPGYSSSQVNNKKISSASNIRSNKPKQKKELNSNNQSNDEKYSNNPNSLNNRKMSEDDIAADHHQQQRNSSRKHNSGKKHQQANTVTTQKAGQENGSGIINQELQEHQLKKQPLQQEQQQHENSSTNSKKIVNPDKDKKIRSVAKKLSDIKKLKARQEQGETLELNQLNKISMETKFLEELKALKLTN